MNGECRFSGEQVMKKIASGYFTVSMWILVGGLLLMGFGFFTTHEPLTTVNSVSEIRNHLGNRVQISTTYARYAGVDLNYNHCVNRRAERVWWSRFFAPHLGAGRDSLYFIEFADGVIIMRGAHRFDGSFIDSHEYISGRVLDIFEDDVSRILLLRYADTLETIGGGELGFYQDTITQQILVRESRFQRNVLAIYPYSVMVSFRASDDEEGGAEFFDMGLGFTVIGGILLILYAIGRKISQKRLVRRERMMDENEVF